MVSITPVVFTVRCLSLLLREWLNRGHWISPLLSATSTDRTLRTSWTSIVGNSIFFVFLRRLTWSDLCTPCLALPRPCHLTAPRSSAATVPQAKLKSFQTPGSRNLVHIPYLAPFYFQCKVSNKPTSKHLDPKADCFVCCLFSFFSKVCSLNCARSFFLTGPLFPSRVRTEAG